MLVSVAGAFVLPLEDDPPEEQLLIKATIEAQIPILMTLVSVDPRLSFIQITLPIYAAVFGLLDVGGSRFSP